MLEAIEKILEQSQSTTSNKKIVLDEHLSHQGHVIKQALQNPLQAIRQSTKNSLYNFIRYFWDTYSTDEFIPNWHIEIICAELEKVARRVAERKTKLYDLIINVPPGTTKTAMVSIFFPVWCWVNWYWMRFITTSHSEPLSLENAEYSREIIRSDKFKMIFPEIGIKKDKDTKSNFRVVKMVQEYEGRAPRVLQGGGRISTSVKAKITGFHAHIIIPDDLVDPHAAVSEAELKTANRHLDQTLSMRKVSKEITVMIMIMQRLAQDDPTGHILAKQKKNVKLVCLPGEIRNYKEFLKPAEFEKYYVDDLLDPVRMSWNALQEMEMDLGQYGYAGQVGQNPVPPGGGMFKTDHFQVIDRLPAPVNFVHMVRYWDKAASDGKGCYTVGVKMSRLQNDKFIIHDVKRGQWSTEVREAIIRQTAEADGENVYVHFEQEPGSGGKDSADGTVINLVGFYAQPDKVGRSEGDKIARADRYSVQVNSGRVMLLYGEWNHVFVDEHKNFPFSTYKDQVDAASGAFRKLVGKKQVKVYA